MAAADYAECERLLKDNPRAQWLASLFVPVHQRPHVQALYAFVGEIGRIADIVSDPMPGEIRLQWWRDALGGGADGQGHPVAAALCETLATCRLPVQPLLDLIDAHGFDLYRDTMPDITSLEGYCGECFSAPLRLAALVLADGGDAGSAGAAGHAGVAIGIAHMLRCYAWDTSRGRMFVPGDVLARYGAETSAAEASSPALLLALGDMRALARHHAGKARQLLRGVPGAVRPAFLPLALVEPTLRLMEKSGYDPFRTPVELAQWRAQWALWRGV